MARDELVLWVIEDPETAISSLSEMASKGLLSEEEFEAIIGEAGYHVETPYTRGLAW
jgi:hypothetical protein